MSPPDDARPTELHEVRGDDTPGDADRQPESDMHGGDTRLSRQHSARAAAALAVTASLAALSTGLAITAALGSAESALPLRDWMLSVAFTTAALFGPGALAALLGARALVRHRPWAPLLLLLVGTLVATGGLVILTVTVSQLAGGENDPYSEFRFLFDRAARGTLVAVAALAVLHVLSGAFEAVAGIMGRHTVRPARTDT